MDIVYMGLALALALITALGCWGCERLQQRRPGGRP